MGKAQKEIPTHQQPYGRIRMYSILQCAELAVMPFLQQLKQELRNKI